MGVSYSLPFAPKNSIPGQTFSVVQMSQDLGYERSDFDKMFGYVYFAFFFPYFLPSIDVR
jgi:hypothetical protein